MRLAQSKAWKPNAWKNLQKGKNSIIIMQKRINTVTLGIISSRTVEWKVTNALGCFSDGSTNNTSCDQLQLSNLVCMLPNCSDPSTELNFTAKNSAGDHQGNLAVRSEFKVSCSEDGMSYRHSDDSVLSDVTAMCTFIEEDVVSR